MDWMNEGQSGTTGGVGSGVAGSVTSSSPIAQYGPFTFGNIGGGNPLPIELVSFTAEVAGNDVVLKWTTAFEVNNSYYRVERSTNGIEFEEVGSVNGNGTTFSTSNYDFIDAEPNMGTSYYQVVQVDFDGKETTYGPVSVTITNSTVSVIKVYPNPIVAGQNLTVEAQGIKTGTDDTLRSTGPRSLFEGRGFTIWQSDQRIQYKE